LSGIHLKDSCHAKVFFLIFLNKNKIDSSDKLEDLHRHSLAKVKEQ
jgi:hypothetical protein